MRVGNSSVKKAPIPLKMPLAKNPRGKPRKSMPRSLIGAIVYASTVIIEQSEKR